DQAEHDQAVVEVAEIGAADQASRHQPPEGSIAARLLAGPVEQAEQGKGREHRADDPVEMLQSQEGRGRRRHFVAFPSARLNRTSRVEWIRKAAIAVGIAQSESSTGDSSIWRAASACWITTIDPI